MKGTNVPGSETANAFFPEKNSLSYQLQTLNSQFSPRVEPAAAHDVTSKIKPAFCKFSQIGLGCPIYSTPLSECSLKVDLLPFEVVILRKGIKMVKY